MIELETEFPSPEEATVVVEGEVDMGSSDQLRDALMEAINRDVTRLVVDFAGVDFIDSSGIATLVEALQKIRDRDGELVLQNLNERVRSVFEVANLLDVFTVE